MAKPGLGNITTNQTFQNWFDKTNELVDIFKSDAITASGSGDITSGDAALLGNFTATTLSTTAGLLTDIISAATAGEAINLNSPVQFNGTSAITTTFNFGTGARTRYVGGVLGWDVGIENTTTGNFIIDTGTGQNKFQLSTAGTLTVPDLVANTITATTITSDNIDLSDLTTDDISEGSANLYFTNNRAIAAVDGASLSSIRANQFTIGGAVATNTSAFIDGTVGIGSIPRGRLNTTFGGSTNPILTWSPTLVTSAVNFEVNGDVIATGDVVTAFSVSDIRLKENLQVIDCALDKITQVSGYTFNYKDKPKERVSGVVAQEIEKVLPEVVFDHERSDGTYKAVRYDNIIPLLLEGIKELKNKIDDLEHRLKDSGK